MASRVGFQMRMEIALRLVYARYEARTFRDWRRCMLEGDKECGVCQTRGCNLVEAVILASSSSQKCKP